jgi:hypothetical protein
MVGVMSFLPLNELPALFPHVVDWISYLEKQAQESGRGLTSIESNLAQHVGVAHRLEDTKELSTNSVIAQPAKYRGRKRERHLLRCYRVKPDATESLAFPHGRLVS